MYRVRINRAWSSAQFDASQRGKKMLNYSRAKTKSRTVVERREKSLRSDPASELHIRMEKET